MLARWRRRGRRAAAAGRPSRSPGRLVHAGPLGAGATLKLAHNVMVYLGYLAVLEAVELGHAAGRRRRPGQGGHRGRRARCRRSPRSGSTSTSAVASTRVGPASRPRSPPTPPCSTRTCGPRSRWRRPTASTCPGLASWPAGAAATYVGRPRAGRRPGHLASVHGCPRRGRAAADRVARAVAGVAGGQPRPPRRRLARDVQEGLVPAVGRLRGPGGGGAVLRVDRRHRPHGRRRAVDDLARAPPQGERRGRRRTASGWSGSSARGGCARPVGRSSSGPGPTGRGRSSSRPSGARSPTTWPTAFAAAPRGAGDVGRVPALGAAPGAVVDLHGEAARDPCPTGGRHRRSHGRR